MNVQAIKLERLDGGDSPTSRPTTPVSGELSGRSVTKSFFSTEVKRRALTLLLGLGVLAAYAGLGIGVCHFMAQVLKLSGGVKITADVMAIIVGGFIISSIADGGMQKIENSFRGE